MANYQLPPWLTQSADPAGSFLRGAHVGSNLAANWQRNRELQMRAALVPYQMAEAELDLKLKANTLDYRLAEKAAQATLAQAYSEIGSLEGGWTNPRALEIMAQVGVKSPSIIGTQIWQHGQENIFRAKTLENQAAQIKTLEQARAAEAYADRARAEKDLAIATDIQLGVRPASGKLSVYAEKIRETDAAQKALEEAITSGDANLIADATERLDRVNRITFGRPQPTLKQKAALAELNAVNKLIAEAQANITDPNQLNLTLNNLLKRRRALESDIEEKEAEQPTARPVTPTAPVTQAAPTTPSNGVGAPVMPPVGMPLMIQTKEQRDKLPKGALYIGPDGKIYRKLTDTVDEEK